MYDRPTVNKVIPLGIIGQGIFTALQLLEVPWQSEDINATLDMDYHGNHSGDKYISPMVYKMLPEDTETLPAQTVNLIANVIFNLYNRNWSKLWATLTVDYNPIQNYDMTETMTDDETVTEYGKSNTRTDNLTATRTDDLAHVKTGTESDNRDIIDNTSNDIYGFNSSDESPADKTDTTRSDDNTHTYNTSESDTGTQTTANTGTQTDASTGSDTQTRNYTLTRSGNIGVTTSQQMLQSERDLWLWNFFKHVVYPDIDRVLTIDIY